MRHLLPNLLLCGLLVVPVADAPTASAPIYAHVSDALMRRAGTLRYPPEPGFEILFCIAAQDNSGALQCVVHTPDDGLMLTGLHATPLVGS